MAIDYKVRCDEVVELVTDYLEGALPVRDREQLEQHVVICSACGTYLAQLRTTMRRSAALATGEPVPASIEQALLERFRTRR